MSQERNISDLIKCTPSGVQERSRSILGEYIYGTGYNENSTCLEVVVKNKGGNVGQFVQKVGDYNFKAVTSETYSPPKKKDTLIIMRNVQKIGKVKVMDVSTLPRKMDLMFTLEVVTPEELKKQKNISLLEMNRDKNNIMKMSQNYAIVPEDGLI